MSFLAKKNFAKSTLSAGIASDGLSLSVAGGDGARFPAAGYFMAALFGAAYKSPDEDPDREIVKAVLSSGDSFTIARAQEGTFAKAWSQNDRFVHVITAAQIVELENAIRYRGALAYSDQAGGNYIPRITYNVFPFEHEDHDTDSFHSTVSNQGRLTIPAGVGANCKARLTANISLRFSTLPCWGHYIVEIRKNGSFSTILPKVENDALNNYDVYINLASAWIPVSAGDYFEVIVWHDAVEGAPPGTPVDLYACDTGNNFSIELKEWW